MDHERPADSSTAAHTQTTDDTLPQQLQPDHIRILTPGSADSGSGVGGHEARTGHTRTPSAERRLINPASEDLPALSQAAENPYADFERVTAPRPARSRDGHIVRMSSRRQTIGSNPGLPAGPLSSSGLDWIVPLEEKGGHAARRTVGERLQPTIEQAIIERDKYARKAIWTGYALNIAIGLQVFLGALTTGLAAAVTSGRQAQISTSILGGLSTLVASYMARARGSGEPELSITRTKDLEQFLRECMSFQMDHAHECSTPENGLDERLEGLRQRFEELLGNGNGERKLSPAGVSAA